MLLIFSDCINAIMMLVKTSTRFCTFPGQSWTKKPSKTVNHNWAEWFQWAHKDLLGSDIETQPAPHQLSYVDRTTKQGLKATFIMNAEERILKDYDFMRAWPTFQGNVMFVMKMKLEEIVYQSEVLWEVNCVPFMLELDRFRWSVLKICLCFSDNSAEPIRKMR